MPGSLIKPFKFLIILIFSVPLLFGCNPTDPGDPPEKVLPGYQEDIPWPSLADSPWPISLADPQRTSRSKFPGPIYGEIEWIKNDFYNTSGLSLGPDNDVYAASFHPQGIYRINSLTGYIDWVYDSLGLVIDIHTVPIVLSDSTVIAATGSEGRLISLSPEGELLWEFGTGSPIYNRGITVDKQGNIYYINKKQNLYSISGEGKFNWSYYDKRFQGFGCTNLTFSPDGNTLYFQGVGVSIIAFDIQAKSVKWTFGHTTMYSYPLVDSQGNIYVLTKNQSINDEHSLYCLYQDSSLKWFYEHGQRSITEAANNHMALDRYGNIYFADDTLYSVNHNGLLRFKKKIGTESHSYNVAIMIDSNNDIYTFQSTGGTTQIYKYSIDGAELWSLTAGLDFLPGYAGVITNNNRIIFSSYEYTKNLVSIK